MRNTFSFMRSPIWLISAASCVVLACQATIPVTKPTGMATSISTVTVPCPLAAADSQYAGWRQVQATGFVFCVPAAWHADSGSTVWKLGPASIEWTTGDYHPSGVRRTVIVTERPVGPGGVPSLPNPPPTPPGVTIRRFTEHLDGRLVQFWYNKIDDMYYTGAVWSSPAFSITGKSKQEDLAGVEMRIYRSTRVEAGG